MNDNKITIEQTGYTYIFQATVLLCSEDEQKLRNTINQQITEGCVLLPAYVKLVSVKPRLEALLQSSGETMVKSWGFYSD